MSSGEYIKPESDPAAQLAVLGYAKSDGYSSLGILREIESHGGNSHILPSGPNISVPKYNDLLQKYKSLIRQLPSKPYAEKLLEYFFHEVNWHYFCVDEAIFLEHLRNWSNLSFSALNRGPQDLPGDLRFFPALLFQVLALALQFQPPDHDPSLDSLKYVSEMSLDDLANDYSESGAAILSLLGKHDINLVTIQAGILRTSFLKNSAMVIESWHSLGQTIRDAREIGWHKDLVGHTPSNPEQAFENLWLVELRKRVWACLKIWDGHMAVVLGRPTQIEINGEIQSIPVDARLTSSRKASAPLPRSETDPPTPLTMLIYTYDLMWSLREILALEKDGPRPKDYSEVERIQQEILGRIENLPPYFRSENPDTTFDTLAECHWLPEVRQIFATNIAFIIMTLHKPYAFSNSKSRDKALVAGLNILQAQRLLFEYLQARHCKMFNLVLSTFDAIVLVAAIYIIYPAENPHFLHNVLQHFEWAMERFNTMSSRNQMAKAALRVLQAIHVRLMKAVNKFSTRLPLSTVSKSANSTSSSIESMSPQIINRTLQMAEHPETLAPTANPHPTASSVVSDSPIAASASPSFEPNGKCLSNPPRPTYGTALTLDPGPTLNTPSLSMNFDPNLIAPLQPMHDLLFNDLVGTPDAHMPIVAENTAPFHKQGSPWQFEGEFTDDSFWNLMNTYNP
jgi:Fungal specific transcription factor domain